MFPLKVALAAVIEPTVMLGVPVRPCAFVASVAEVAFPEKVVAVTTPVTLIPEELIVTADPTFTEVAVATPRVTDDCITSPLIFVKAISGYF
jgi:type IV secretory pathway VirB3-like protein